MGVRTKPPRRLRISQRDHLRTLLLVICITCVPVFGTVFAIVNTTEPDLSERTPISRKAGQYAMLNWSGLHQASHADAAVQALGYMLESGQPVRSGDWVQDFVLVPDAGNLLHPAHRIPDEMIAVRLLDGEQIQFSPRSLVWAWGTFRATPGDSAGLQPLFRLDRARAKPAAKSDVSKYFR